MWGRTTDTTVRLDIRNSGSWPLLVRSPLSYPPFWGKLLGGRNLIGLNSYGKKKNNPGRRVLRVSKIYFSSPKPFHWGIQDRKLSSFFFRNESNFSCYLTIIRPPLTFFLLLLTTSFTESFNQLLFIFLSSCCTPRINVS